MPAATKPFKLSELEEVTRMAQGLAKNGVKIEYHVFTNERDEWFYDLKPARKLYNEWALEYGSARLYMEERSEDFELLSEDCIFAFGEYPM